MGLLTPFFLFSIGIIFLVPFSYADTFYEIKDKEDEGRLVWGELEELKKSNNTNNDEEIKELEEEFEKILRYLQKHGVGVAYTYHNNPDYWKNSNKLPTLEYSKEYQVIILNKYFDEFNLLNSTSNVEYKITFTQKTKDYVIVKFPNNFGLMDNIDFGFTWGLVFEPYGDLIEYDGICYRTHVIKPESEYSSLEIGVASVATGRWVHMYYDVEQFCYELFENPPSPKDCSPENQNHINRRGESVCVSSVKELIDRGYLV